MHPASIKKGILTHSMIHLFLPHTHARSIRGFTDRFHSMTPLHAKLAKLQFISCNFILIRCASLLKLPNKINRARPANTKLQKQFIKAYVSLLPFSLLPRATMFVGT